MNSCKVVTPPCPFRDSVPTPKTQKRFTEYVRLMQASGYKLPPPERSAGRPPQEYRVASPVAAALAMLILHPDWSDKEIAAFVGCRPATLSESPLYTKAREALAAGRQEMDRGAKSRDGSVEAWSAQTEERFHLAAQRKRSQKRPRHSLAK